MLETREGKEAATDKLLAKDINQHLRAQMETMRQGLDERGIMPALATVRVGQRASDISYEKGIQKTLGKLRITVESVALEETASEDELVETLQTLSANPDIHGILLMQPLPDRMEAERVKAAIAPEKDVDGATLPNLGRTLAGTGQGFTYCAPSAVMELLDYYQVPLKGANVVLIGSGLVVGRPLALLLADRFATVTMTNVYSKNVPAIARTADILISAAGVAGLVDETYVREGQIVIDVGTSFKDGKLHGDVNWEAIQGIVKAATPTPGGIGGITTTVLAKHVIQACLRIHGLSEP